MKFFVVAALAATAFAAGIADLPQCSQQCAHDAAAKIPCADDDVPCLCKNINTLQANAASCIIAACGQDKTISMFSSAFVSAVTTPY